jgi:septal ring factor EnvC (AmiA/AmiB activator)
MSFQKPINANITQRFGADFQQSDGRWYYKQVLGYNGHNGDDYAAPVGTPVYAADDGTVAFEGWGQNHSWMGAAAGICVLINNGGVYSGYAHLSGTTVNKGQTVAKGQLIGTVGSTGAATGPHLHFEALPLVPNFKNGYAGRIDPSQFVVTSTPNASVDQVKQAYRDILEREADQAGINTYTQKTLDFVRSDLAGSQEYRDLQARKAAVAQAAKDAETKRQEEARLAAQKAEQDRIAKEAAALKAKLEAEAAQAALEAEEARIAAEKAAEAEALANKDEALALARENNTLLKQIWAAIKRIFNLGA